MPVPQDERNSGISTSSIGIQPFPSAKKRIAGGRESDTLTKRKSRWINWKVRPDTPCLSCQAPCRAAG